MEAEEHTNNRLTAFDKLLLSGTFLACARGTVVSDRDGEFNIHHGTKPVPHQADSEAFKEAFILFSRN